MKRLKLIGKVFMIISILFMIHAFSKIEFTWKNLGNPRVVILIIFICACIGVLGNMINAFVWCMYLQYIENKRLDKILLMSVYLKSNTAKYFPGNIGQYIGRNLLGSKLGITQSAMVMATLLEIGCICVTAFLVSVIASYQNVFIALREIIKVAAYTKIAVCIGITMSVVIIILIIIFYKKGLLHRVRQFCNLKACMLLVQAMLFYAIMLILSGSMVVIVLQVIFEQSVNFLTILSVNTLSWTMGYIVPGAPGGIGIKEFVMSLLLNEVYAKDIILTAIVIVRISCIIGDILSFLAGYAAERYRAKEKRKYKG